MRFKAISAGDGVHKLVSVMEQPETSIAVELCSPRSTAQSLRGRLLTDEGEVATRGCHRTATTSRRARLRRRASHASVADPIRSTKRPAPAQPETGIHAIAYVHAS